MSKREPGVIQRHSRRCPRDEHGHYRPHRCTGTWANVIDVGTANGKRKQEKKGGFPTRQEAADARRVRLGQVRGRSGESYGLTVAEYLEQWLSWKRGIRDSTRLSYRYHLDQYLIPRIGDYRLADLERRPEVVEDLVASLTDGVSGRALSATSVRRVHATLRSALGSAVKRRMLSHNPAAAVELPSGPRYRPEVWDGEQVGAFLNAIEEHRLSAMFLLIVLAGLRRGEAVGLRWADLDLDGGVMHVRQQVVAVGREVRIGPPKTQAGERTVALAEAVVASLRTHRDRQRNERAAWGEAWTDTGLVFTHEDGTMLRPDYVTHLFARLTSEAGVARIRLHNLRHTSASLALAAQVPMKVVSEQLGHSSPSITAALYTVVVPAVARDAAERIADAVPTLRRNRETAPAM